jgi:hypothetical protein
MPLTACETKKVANDQLFNSHGVLIEICYEPRRGASLSLLRQPANNSSSKVIIELSALPTSYQYAVTGLSASDATQTDT